MIFDKEIIKAIYFKKKKKKIKIIKIFAQIIIYNKVIELYDKIISYLKQ